MPDDKSWSWPDLARAVVVQPRFSSAPLALGLVLLFAPDRWLSKFGLAAFRDSYRVWVGPVTLVLLVIWCIQCWSAVGRIGTRWRMKRTRRASIIRMLQSLADGERELLARCLIDRTNTFYTSLTDPRAHSLAEKGITIRASGGGSIIEWPSVITEEVWQYINAHPYIVLGAETIEQFSARTEPFRLPHVRA